MKLLTKEIEKKIPKIYATEGIPLKEKTIVAKFFTPWTGYTWYAVEGEHLFDTNDFVFFGYVEGLEKEWGYFSLEELESIKGPFGLKVERDRHFTGYKIKDVIK